MLHYERCSYIITLLSAWLLTDAPFPKPIAHSAGPDSHLWAVATLWLRSTVFHDAVMHMRLNLVRTRPAQGRCKTCQAEVKSRQRQSAAATQASQPYEEIAAQQTIDLNASIPDQVRIRREPRLELSPNPFDPWLEISLQP